jgi:hypothetical protein
LRLGAGGALFLLYCLAPALQSEQEFLLARGDLEVRALWCSRFDNESMSVDELRGRLRVARASATFFQGAIARPYLSCQFCFSNRTDQDFSAPWPHSYTKLRITASPLVRFMQCCMHKPW